MLCGLPGSGKSFVAKYFKELNNDVMIHSSDQLREELFGDINECNKNEELFNELHKRIKQDLINGKDIIYDATNISYKKRKAFLEQFKKINCEKICYLIATPYKKCLEQNNQRDKKVPEYIIKKMYMNLYIPQYYEGWDKIEIIYMSFGFKDIEGTLVELDSIEHDNPHHTFTIGKHCRMCAENIDKLSNKDDELYWAAILHDIGKKFTKGFKNAKGEPSEIAHYYQHHLISAYNSLFLLTDFDDETILRITNYIQWHMQPFFMKEQKTIDKFIKLVGQEFYDNLLLLHQADRDAH